MRSAVPGVPLDAEYVVFIVDASGSMRQYAWDKVQATISETLRLHTRPGTRIHAVLMPVYLEVAGELLSSARYAMLMRELTLRHGGAFMAPASL